MSSSPMDQAFVKAFARRNRPGRQGTEGQQGAEQPVPSQTGAAGAMEVTPNPDPAVAPGTLQVDWSVASTADVWIDTIEDQMARADQASTQVPRPHVEPNAAPADAQPVERPPETPNAIPAGTATITSEPVTREPESPNPESQDPESPNPESQDPESYETAVPHPVIQEPVPTSPIVETARSLEHVHTAYAAALTEIPILPVQMPDDVPLPEESSEAVDANEAAESDPTPLSETEPSAGPCEAIVGAEPAVVDSPAPAETETPSVAEESDESSPQGQPTDGSSVTQMRIDPPVTRDKPSPTVVPFQAAWEVDVFDIPTSVADLFFEGVLFQQIAERMSEAVAGGLRSALITSTKRGEGRSSVAIGMAMAAAATGIRVALVDADTEEPTLADDLRLDVRYGWVDSIRGGLPIREVAIHAVEDGVTLIPLMPPGSRGAATAYEVVQLIDRLREKFDLVIIDGPTGASVNIHQCASAVDSAIIVRDVSRTDTYAVNEFSYRLRESGVQGVGVVENYV